VAPSIELIAVILGEAFGQTPWSIMEEPADKVLRTWILWSEMQPKKR
jgi:hypothetical protein